jgi:serine/threonine protein kinase/tetratricopeptide (TPR) repeat protein
MPLVAGRHLGCYEILAPLGAGGMGEVYRARDTRLKREVALKVLPTEFANDPERVARFEREARTVATLNHPNIVVLYSVEDAEGVRFLTMELVEGASLDQHMVPCGLPFGRVLDLGIALADALSAAHEKGVVHRDLKPANVMLSRDGRVKVLDFGLARLTSVDPESHASQSGTNTPALTSEGKVLGTVPYMAPEQLLGEPADARADVFALGILLYEIATGLHPFRGNTTAEVTSSILRDVPAPAHVVRKDLHLDLSRVITRCLDKDPDRRTQTAKDVRNELELMRRATQTGPLAAHGGGEVPSVAVLPFTTTGHAEDDEDFALGITDDVIAHLCKVRGLRVISRASVMQFRKRDVALEQIALRLNVGNVLDGSVRKIGDRVRIVPQLVEVATGRNLWAETYDRRLTDIFEIQTDVALQIAAALEAELSPKERERINRGPTLNIDAYEEYLRGRRCFLRYTPEAMLESIECFDRALALDPRFALAHVGRAISFSELVEVGAFNREQSAAQALSSGAKAVALDPERGEAHCALAYTRMLFEFDWEGAEAGFKRAIELSPGYSEAYDLYGRMLASIERYDEAIALLQRAYELDPLSARADLVTSMVRAGRYEEAIRTARRFLVSDPDFTRLHTVLGWALFRIGRVNEGIVELQRGVALSPNEALWLAQLGQAYGLAGRRKQALEILQRLESWPTPVSPYHMAYVHIGLSDLERALDFLEQAFETGSGATIGVKGSFLFAPLRGHPRFTALLKRIRLA